MSAELLALLDGLDAAREKATPGEWMNDPVNGVHTPTGTCIALSARHADDARRADAALIVAAVNSLPKLTAALRAVLASHRPVQWQECDEEGVPDLDKPLGAFCAECTDDDWTNAVEFGDTIDAAADVVGYPCRTVDAIAAALTTEQADR